MCLVFGKLFERIAIIGFRCWHMQKLSVHFTKCFEGPIHQVLYLCTGQPRAIRATFLAMDRIPHHIGVRTLYVKGIFRDSIGTPGGQKCVVRVANHFHLSCFYHHFTNPLPCPPSSLVSPERVVGCQGGTRYVEVWWGFQDVPEL